MNKPQITQLNFDGFKLALEENNKLTRYIGWLLLVLIGAILVLALVMMMQLTTVKYFLIGLIY